MGLVGRRRSLEKKIGAGGLLREGFWLVGEGRIAVVGFVYFGGTRIWVARDVMRVRRGGVFLHLNLFLIDYFDDCIDMKKCS